MPTASSITQNPTTVLAHFDGDIAPHALIALVKALRHDPNWRATLTASDRHSCDVDLIYWSTGALSHTLKERVGCHGTRVAAGNVAAVRATLPMAYSCPSSSSSTRRTTSCASMCLSLRFHVRDVFHPSIHLHPEGSTVTVTPTPSRHRRSGVGVTPTPWRGVSMKGWSSHPPRGLHST